MLGVGTSFWGGGGSKIGKIMKQKKPKSTLLADTQHTRAENNNKTNKAQASHFCRTASHHSSKWERNKGHFNAESVGGGGGTFQCRILAKWHCGYYNIEETRI